MFFNIFLIYNKNNFFKMDYKYNYEVRLYGDSDNIKELLQNEEFDEKSEKYDSDLADDLEASLRDVDILYDAICDVYKDNKWASFLKPYTNRSYFNKKVVINCCDAFGEYTFDTFFPTIRVDYKGFAYIMTIDADGYFDVDMYSDDDVDECDMADYDEDETSQIRRDSDFDLAHALYSVIDKNVI